MATIPNTPYPERRQEERREACKEHEGRMDDIENKMSSQASWTKAVAAGVSVTVAVIIFTSGIIINKLGEISTFIGDSKAAHGIMMEKIGNLDLRVKDIEVRHTHIDQTGYIPIGSPRHK